MSTALAVSPGGAGASLPTRRASAALRILAALAVMAAAYHYSLSTLVRNLGVDSPLAYLGLVFVAKRRRDALEGARAVQWYIQHNKVAPQFINVPGYFDAGTRVKIFNGDVTAVDKVFRDREWL